MQHRRSASTLFLLAVILAMSTNSVQVNAQNTVQLTATREVNINVKLVFVGIDSQSVHLQYLNWNSPERRYQLTVIPGVSTQTSYAIKYDFVFAPASFQGKFSSFLNSIAKTEKRTNVLWNESYFKIEGSYFLNYTHYPVNSTNTYYSADEVESWLSSNANDFGGLIADGYTLIIADLSNSVPSVTPSQFQSIGTPRPQTLTPHFFNKTFTDHDLGIELNRRYMTAWGGHNRFFLIDLSAGPAHAAEQYPVQIAAWLNRIDRRSQYWATWFTQFVADYVAGAVYNLFLPDFVYPINYAKNYRVEILVFDNRTRPKPPIESTVDQNEIQSQLSNLLPFANVQVDLKFYRLSENEQMFEIVKSSTSPSPVGIQPIIDARPIYEWLSASGRGRISDFARVSRTSENYDIPVFVFAFEGNYTLGFTFKEFVVKDVDFDRTIWGVALYDMVLISHSATDLERGNYVTPPQPGMGFGFTNTIIHEVGHMVGLMHPFHTSYDPTENFVSSVMAYYPYEDSFSQFDKDALLRGYTDQTIRRTHEILRATPSILINSGDLNLANSKLRDAEVAYKSMNYIEALKNSQEAYSAASRANLLAGGGSFTGPAFAFVLAAFSFLLGGAAVFVMLRRGSAKTPAHFCSVCHGRLTWIAQYQRWYCYRCQRYE